MSARLEPRLDELRATGRSGIAPYVTAGDGGLPVTRAILEALEEAGAACVELGVPFSDPIADGPVLQAAAGRALAAGTTLDGILALVASFRAAGGTLPLALFSYANPLVRRGWDSVAGRAADAGVDAFLVPDLPVEEGAEMRAALARAGLCPVFFVAPTTSDERVRAAAAASRGFLYAIGRFGVTGAETRLDGSALEFLARVRSCTDLPLGVGFGIRDADQVRAVTSVAELAIVGSSLVERIHATLAATGDPAAAARAAAAYVRELQRGLAQRDPLQGSRSPA